MTIYIVSYNLRVVTVERFINIKFCKKYKMVNAKFQGKPVIDLSKVPLAGFLTAKFGEEVFREAGDLALKKYKSVRPLIDPNIVYQNGVVQGSNSFYVVLVNEVLRQNSSKQLWTASPSDMERTLRAGDVLGIKGSHYVDTALVLRSAEDSYNPNKSLAGDLAEQVRKRQGKKSKLPVMIPLRYLDLKVNNNEYGLSFMLREDAEIVQADVLNKPGRFSSSDINPQTGLPNETGDRGDRGLYIKRDGLSRLFLSSDLDLDSSWDSLYNSSASGRVVVCGEAARAENLDGLLEYKNKFL